MPQQNGSRPESSRRPAKPTPSAEAFRRLRLGHQYFMGRLGRPRYVPWFVYFYFLGGHDRAWFKMAFKCHRKWASWLWFIFGSCTLKVLAGKPTPIWPPMPGDVRDMNHTYTYKKYIWRFLKTGVPQNRWFIMENTIQMDDLEVPPFQETYTTLLCPELKMDLGAL